MEAGSKPGFSTWALALVVPVVAAVVAVVTLSVTSDTSSSTTANEVTIKDFTFAPSPLRVKAGTTVTVANDDGTAHTFTADDGAFDTGRIDGGAHTTITIGTAGTYAYHCKIHSSMTGVIDAT